MTLLRAFGSAAVGDLGRVSSEDSGSRSGAAPAEPTNPTPNAAMPPKRARLPFEKVVARSLEPLACDSLSRSLTVAPGSTFEFVSHLLVQDLEGSPCASGASVDLAAHHLNGRYERTNAFIVPQRFPRDRPAGEIEYRPTDAGTIKVSA
jgi:hypothetical protein